MQPLGSEHVSLEAAQQWLQRSTAGADLIGGIGVSGGSAEQDEACARAGLQAIGLG